MSNDPVMSNEAERLIPLRNPKAERTRPPSFEEAKNRRQKVRAAGMHPDYWYPVGWDADVPRGKAVGVVFWKRNIRFSILCHCTANTLGAVLTLIALLLAR